MAQTKVKLIDDNAIKAHHIDETATGITLADLVVNGNTGIGTSTPQSILHISESAPVITATSTNDASGLRLNVTGTANEAFRFQYNGTSLATILSNGNLGVGSASPAYKLDVAGDIRTTGNLYMSGNIIQMANNDGFVYDDGANVMKVKYDGTEYNIWTQNNDGSGSGLDADLLDGSQGTYYDHRRYTDSNNYLGGYYTSGGTEKPNNAAFGPGKLKVAMLRNLNLGFGNTWNDVLWMSTYSGSDVKLSTVLVSGKNDGTSLWIAKQNFDSSSWGTGYLIWNSGNDGSGSGLDADLLDGVQGSSYLRSDASDTFTGTLTLAGTLSMGTNSISTSSGARVTTPSGYLKFGSLNSSWVHYETDRPNHYFYENIWAAGYQVQTSDARIKENVVTIDNALDKVKSIRGVYYNRIGDKDKIREIGFIAQEVNDAVPELAAYAEDMDEWAVKYANFVGLHNEAIKELSNQIEALKAEIESLKQA